MLIKHKYSQLGHSQRKLPLSGEGRPRLHHNTSWQVLKQPFLHFFFLFSSLFVTLWGGLGGLGECSATTQPPDAFQVVRYFPSGSSLEES